MSKAEIQKAMTQVTDAKTKLEHAQALLRSEGHASYRLEVGIEQIVEAEQYINGLMQKGGGDDEPKNG